MILRRLHALFNSEVYHGWGKEKSYFEGWYYKLVSKDEQHIFAIIPGVAMDNKGSKQAFVQVLDGKTNKAHYIKYMFEEFMAQPNSFDVKVENNSFTLGSVALDSKIIKGKVHMTEHTPWSNEWYSPGIMGPFSFVPFMQCYHGILSMNHSLNGSLVYEGKEISFDGGKGYMEKDWGRSFPSGYIWMQSNHFNSENVSLKSSVARIPWIGSSFTGYIAGVLIQDRIIEFTTYNNTKLRKCHVDKEKVELVYENGKHLLEIEAIRSSTASLASPIQGFMDGRINESMTSILNIKLSDKKNDIILLEDSGKNAGLEVAGDLSTLLK